MLSSCERSPDRWSEWTGPWWGPNYFHFGLFRNSCFGEIIGSIEWAWPSIRWTWLESLSSNYPTSSTNLTRLYGKKVTPQLKGRITENGYQPRILEAQCISLSGFAFWARSSLESERPIFRNLVWTQPELRWSEPSKTQLVLSLLVEVGFGSDIS